jgi:hypothetical protein
MMAATTAMCTSYKKELGMAQHDHTNTTGDAFLICLIIPSMAGTYGAASTNYSDVTGNSDEVPNGSGYTTGGFAYTAAHNITPLSSGTVAYWGWDIDPTWTSATLDTAACMTYNSSNGNSAVDVHDFGGTQSVSDGTLTTLEPSNDSTNARIKLA